MSPHRATSLAHLHAALPDLAAEAGARALEFEEKRKLAPDFADKLKRAGAFKVLVPADAGGLGGSLNDWLEVAMTLAEADASTGWVMSHANICAGLIYALADPRLREAFFADPDACAAWSSLPRVQVTEEADGVRITGGWGFESGCTAATFVGGMVTLAPGADGKPRVLAALAPISEATIVESWDPVGLAGTARRVVGRVNINLPKHHDPVSFSPPSPKSRRGSRCRLVPGSRAVK